MVDDATKVQAIAKTVMSAVRNQIKIGMTERDVAELAEREFVGRGIRKFWYYGIAAFVLVGERTPLSMSGREYKPSDTVIADGDLLTIDLSPVLGIEWGDYARSMVVTQEEVFLDEFPFAGSISDGLKVERQLHEELLKWARPMTTFHEVFEQMNNRIIELGYLNLDFKGNLGHSIERNPDLRMYIEQGNDIPLSKASRFTFEPHIRRANEMLGFKRENIYRFEEGHLLEV